MNDQPAQQPRQYAVANLNDDRLGQVLNTFGRLIKILVLGMGALCLTQNVFAQFPSADQYQAKSHSQVSPRRSIRVGDLFDTDTYEAKGLYYDGLAFEFLSDASSGINMLGQNYTTYAFNLTAWYWNPQDNGGSWDISWFQPWGYQEIPIVGSLGACVFNGLLYCFFTTAGQDLQYVTVDPASQQATGPTSIAGNVSPNGAAAAVCGGAIYIFTANQAFTSKDGTNFAVWPLSKSLSASQMLDAVTFYPAGTDPAGILIVYNSSDSPPQLEAAMVYPTNNVVFGGNKLPWPPVNKCLWGPVVQGNLVLGTGASYPGPGAKAPCVQFYGFTSDNLCDGEHLGRWEYNLSNQTWTFYNWDQNAGGYLEKVTVWPWFDTMDSVRGTMRLSHILSVGYNDPFNGETTTIYANRSDWMVPQNNDPTYGWVGTPTATANATGDTDQAKMLRSLWTLVGFVLGPPPFALNGATDGSGLSQVQYGIDLSQSVSTTETSSRTLSVAMNNKIKGGLGQVTLDLSYAHAWNASHQTGQSVEVSTYYNFGPAEETPPDQGLHGWAIFNAPTFVTQQNKVYAYDYDQSTGQGTYLNQDVYATSLGAVVPRFEYFSLANPAEGGITNLFQGLPVYPNSTDIPGWFHIRDWNNGGSDWTTIFGDLSNPPVGTLDIGADVTQTYTQTASTNYSQGNNNSFSIDAGTSFNFFGGFSSGVTVGYDTEFGTETDVASTLTKSVSCSLNMPIPPNGPGYVNSMTIQPYWLQAKTANAPWIPPGYRGNLPWCITWDVSSYATTASTPGGAVTAGAAPPPVSASGIIRSGLGLDSYNITTAHMTWIGSAGQETSLPMTAGNFDAVSGATVFLNGSAFSANASSGKWTRTGDVWKFRSGLRATTGPFTVALDFAKKTWSFDAFSLRLDQEFKAGDDKVRVELVLPGSYPYRFAHWLKHDIDATWSLIERPSSWKPYGVHEIDGAYNSQTGAGHLNLQGHIPKQVASFGDLVLRVNGASVSIPLLSLDGFLANLAHSRPVRYNAQGLRFLIDFRTGLWQATINGNQFKPEMAPKDGAIRVQVLLGGGRLSDQTMLVQNYTSILNYNPSLLTSQQ